MDKFVVRGGNRLEGDIYVSGAKNAAVAIIPAVILSDEPCTLENVPDISDVSIGLKILREMGAKVDMVDRTTFTIDATHLMNSEVPYDMDAGGIFVEDDLAARDAVCFRAVVQFFLGFVGQRFTCEE